MDGLLLHLEWEPSAVVWEGRRHLRHSRSRYRVLLRLGIGSWKKEDDTEALLQTCTWATQDGDWNVAGGEMNLTGLEPATFGVGKTAFGGSRATSVTTGVYHGG